MTLDEAIKHCKEKAKAIWQANEEMPSDCKLSKGLCECAEEHEQLAEWLEELKEWRKLTAVCAFDGYVVYKERTEVSDIGLIEGYCDTCKHNEGYPASNICQGCKEFDHYERKEQKNDTQN